MNSHKCNFIVCSGRPVASSLPGSSSHWPAVWCYSGVIGQFKLEKEYTMNLHSFYTHCESNTRFLESQTDGNAHQTKSIIYRIDGTHSHELWFTSMKTISYQQTDNLRNLQLGAFLRYVPVVVVVVTPNSWVESARLRWPCVIFRPLQCCS